MPSRDTSRGTTKRVAGNGEEYYRIFMERVEPDLLPENLERLSSLYPGETPDQSAVRYSRYAVAFFLLEAYVRHLEMWTKTTKKRADRKVAIAAAEALKATESLEIKDIENQINAAS